MAQYPVESTIPELAHALRSGTAAVLQAPPGAGKTTIVPPALLAEPWLAGRRIVMLEPRRLAARAAARRMAQLRGEEVGDTVGYRVRLDSRVGPRTRIEVVTEGILTRMLQDDPTLDGTGLVIFDEFHERSLHGDLGLALARQAQQLLRPDLRILVMSATLEGTRVAALLGGAPVIASEGRLFPVAVRYLGAAGIRRERTPGGTRYFGLESAVAGAVRLALEEQEGDVLVFLPGAGEIRRTAAQLSAGLPDRSVRVVPLFGALPPAEQDAAIAPSRAGERKVVLATSIAQTSLTIEGVRVVVDAGLTRGPRFSPRSGMTRLETARVSRASAEQRAGRAGRLAPGTCLRLWDERDQAGLVPHDIPEIVEADLAPLALQLALAGTAEPRELAWLDPPPHAAFGQARELLRELGALDPAGAITARGARMARLPLHPRLAHMLLEGARLGAGALAADIAALLGDRDLLPGAPSADLALRLEALRGTGGADAGADRESLRRARAEAAELRRQARGRDEDAATLGRLLAFAYPDRIAQRRDGSGTPGQAAARYLLRGGGGASLPAGDPLATEPWLVVAETDGARPESRIQLAAPASLEQLLEDFGDQVEQEEAVTWDAAAGSVLARRHTRLGAIMLADAPLRDPDPEAVAQAQLKAIRAEGLASLHWSDAALGLRRRVQFLTGLDPSWPDFSDAALLESLDAWLGSHLRGVRRRDERDRIDLRGLLLARLDWTQREALDRLAPTHVALPGGARIAIDYGEPSAPVLAARVQELFGLTETPRIGGGTVPLTVHLLSPARRPVQVTRDLAAFWRTTYAEVRKELKGRYPKHRWPENPHG